MNSFLKYLVSNSGRPNWLCPKNSLLSTCQSKTYPRSQFPKFCIKFTFIYIFFYVWSCIMPTVFPFQLNTPRQPQPNIPIILTRHLRALGYSLLPTLPGWMLPFGSRIQQSKLSLFNSLLTVCHFPDSSRPIFARNLFSSKRHVLYWRHDIS